MAPTFEQNLAKYFESKRHATNPVSAEKSLI